MMDTDISIHNEYNIELMLQSPHAFANPLNEMFHGPH